MTENPNPPQKNPYNPNNTPVNPNQNPMAQPKKNSSKKIWMVVAAVTAVVLIVGSLVSFFVPFFGQTIAARGMDAVGQHKLAMQLDAIHQDPTMAAMSSIDTSNPESCADLWNYVDEARVSRLEAMQFKQLITVQPVNQAYVDDFSFETYLDARMSMVEQRAWAEMELTGNMNGDRLNELLDSSSDETLSGNVSIDVAAEAYLNTDGGYFRIPTLDIRVGELNTFDSLNDWYEGRFNLSNLQQEGIDEILSVIMDLSETQAQDMLSEETGRTLMKSYCQMIEEIDVQAPADVTIGRDQETVRARPVVLTTKSNVAEIQAEVMPDMTEAVLNDQKLVDFLKSKYPEFERITLAIEKIDRSLNPNPLTQEEYEEGIQETIDDARESFDKEDYREQLERSAENASSEFVEIENRPVELLY